MNLEIRRLAYGLGAEIRGLNPKVQSAEEINAVRAAWLEHLVVVFTEMDMSLEEHIALSRHFGELLAHPNPGVRDDARPEVMRVTNLVENGKRSNTANVGRKWHSDGAYRTNPPTASLLHCRAIPDVGGDTWFTNMYMAYETLSETMRNIIDELYVVNSIARAASVKERGPHEVDRALAENPPVVHKLVREHPETGRKALYLNETVTEKILGMTEEESEGLLKYLYTHSVRSEFTFRHKWRVDDLVMWDNRCTMHLAPKDYHSDQLRDMRRTTLKGVTIGRFA